MSMSIDIDLDMDMDMDVDMDMDMDMDKLQWRRMCHKLYVIGGLVRSLLCSRFSLHSYVKISSNYFRNFYEQYLFDTKLCVRLIF